MKRTPSPKLELGGHGQGRAGSLLGGREVGWNWSTVLTEQQGTFIWGAERELGTATGTRPGECSVCTERRKPRAAKLPRACGH